MKTARIRFFLAIMIAVWLGVASSPAFAATIHVDDSVPTNGDGSTWNQAYNTLQEAIANANAGDEIRVGPGTYKPDLNSPYDRTASFALLDQVHIKGGFAGYGHTTPDLHNPLAFHSVLSGDLTGNDNPSTPSTYNENSYHVVFSPDGTDHIDDFRPNLEGFFITGGNADDSVTHNSGGGIWIDGGEPLIQRCFIFDNKALVIGGGIHYVTAGETDADPKIVDCWIYNNTARDEGAGVGNSLAKGLLLNCIIHHNICTGGVSSIGGGVMAKGDEQVMKITNCLIYSNEADDQGGGIFAIDVIVQLLNCTVSDNTAGDGQGGGYYLGGTGSSSTPSTIKSSIFWDNHGGTSGHEIFVAAGC